MKTINAVVKVRCLESEHLAVSSFLKTILHTLDVGIETRNPANDFRYTLKGEHPDAVSTNV